MDQNTFPNADPITTIKVNDELVAVNKQILAHNSAYFDRYFFDHRYPAAKNIELPESTTVEDFKRMIAILPRKQHLLDDDCIETILILADRFAMDSVIKSCQNFLMMSSRKLFAIRMARKYGWNEMESKILKSMLLDEFIAWRFVENATEFAMLGDGAKVVLARRHAELVSSFYYRCFNYSRPLYNADYDTLSIDDGGFHSLFAPSMGGGFNAPSSFPTTSRKQLYKFRIAHENGQEEMEKEILQSMAMRDFAPELFVENATEFAMLDDSAKAVIAARLAKLISGK